MARENGFVQNEGTANELAAQFYLKRGIEKVAYSYFRDARYCYLRWGAPGKVQRLDECYPAIDDRASLRPTTLEKSDGFGLSNMRTRASQIGGKLDIQTAAGRGTSIVLTVPISSR